jgi:hypothetical protein
MNIKFEWTDGEREITTNQVIWFYCWVGRVCVGKVWACFGGRYDAEFGGGHSRANKSAYRRPTTLDEAKAWVEEQAQAWLKEVTA